jgi:hypothetical protein
MKSIEATLGTRLSAPADTAGLLQAYEELKEQTYSPALRGFVPDRRRSIANFSRVIEDLSERFRRIVVFGCDAISFDYFMSDVRGHFAGDDATRMTVLSSVFPTTSSCGWSSIITGTRPSENGVYGVSFLHEEHDASYVWITNCLSEGARRVEAGSETRVYLSSTQTLFRRLADAGRECFLVGKYGRSDVNPLMSELSDGATCVPLPDGFHEMKQNPPSLTQYFLETTEKLLREQTAAPLLIWNYIDFDVFIHQRGFDNSVLDQCWQDISRFWQEFAAPDTAFLIISDHGQTEQQISEFNILAASEKNEDLAHNSGGAGRTLFFYPKKGREQAVHEWLNELIGDSGLILTRDELKEHGLIERDARDLERVGYFVALAQDKYFPSATPEAAYEHGSLNAQEIFVPFVLKAGN